MQQYRERFQQADELMVLAKEEKDDSLLQEVEKDLNLLHKEIHNFFLKTLMTGEADKCDCFIEIRAGSGGHEACDWTRMLSRMYERWAAQQGYKSSIVDQTPAEGAVGLLKSSIIQISGDYAYGWAKHEAGVHRFARVSPFDANGKKHTSFASVQVLPVQPEDAVQSAKSIAIPASDLKVEVMRAQGAGGQHVNKTESAVRLTHIPTGISVLCQAQRSQHQNKAMAMVWLQGKLYKKHLQEKQKQKDEAYANQGEAAWGHQIRTYVLQPYQMIKDARTGHSRTDVQNVLDGDLQDYMEAAVLTLKSSD